MPLLWHLPMSHFSEKVRWALDWRRVPHRRRIMPPGLHPFGGLLLTRGRQYTMPVLVMDGHVIGDSTAIVAALEERYVPRSLYPADADERARALELEDWFDENVGPHVRQWAFRELLADPDGLREFAAKQLEWAPAGLPVDSLAGFAKAFVNVRYSLADDGRAAEAREGLVAGLDRLEAELSGGGAGSGEFLVGRRFTVADLTAAALFYPLVLPPEGPWLPRVRPPEFTRFRDSVRDRPGFRWVEDAFRRHRHAARPSAPAGSV
jgi:glutathione S-transferase